MSIIRLISPLGHRAGQSLPAAPGLRSLSHKTICLLDNSKTNADRLLGYIEQVLKRDHGVGRVYRHVKPSGAAPLRHDEVDRIAAGCDAVISAAAD